MIPLKSSGFTLIEVMVTVAIIAILAAIAIPNYMSYRKSAQVRTCLENIAMLDSATKACIITHNLPNGADVTLDMLLPAASGDTSKYFIMTMPICPAGGEYKYNKSTLSWGCTLGGGAEANGGFPHGGGVEN